MTDIYCQLEQAEKLTSTVQRLVLKPSMPMNFKAGQYLRVVMGEKDRRPFSIASHPNDELLELHIGATPDNAYAWDVLKSIETQGSCHIDGPHGEAYLRTEKVMPTILLAGGTGFSYTWSILLALLEQAHKEPIFFYWGTRTEQDLYAAEALVALTAEHDNLTFVPVVEFPEADWSGKTGRVHEAIINDFASLEPYQVYVAGRFEMAGVAREDFCKQGLQKDNLYGDAYAFI